MLQIGQIVVLESNEGGCISEGEHIDLEVSAPLYRLEHATGVSFSFSFLTD